MSILNAAFASSETQTCQSKCLFSENIIDWRPTAFAPTSSDGAKWAKYIVSTAGGANTDLECALLCNYDAKCDYHIFSGSCYFGSFSATASILTGSPTSGTTYTKLKSRVWCQKMGPSLMLTKLLTFESRNQRQWACAIWPGDQSAHIRCLRVRPLLHLEDFKVEVASAIKHPVPFSK